MNSNNSLQPSIHDKVLSKIQCGDVRMRPRYYFTLKVIALVLITCCVLLMSSFLFSYILFSIKISGELFLLGFGLRGIQAFIILFPWTLFLIDLLFILILEKLIKHFKFGYKHSFIYLSLSITLFVIVAGLIINSTSIHRDLLNHSEKHPTPVVGGFYEHLRKPKREKGIFEGKIIETHDTSFSMHMEPDPEPYIVEGSTLFHIDSLLKRDDMVFVAGILQGHKIQAYGIHKTEN